MAFIRQRITLIRNRRPSDLDKRNINLQLQWFGSSIGLFGLRDKDKSCFRLFIELLKAAKQNKPLSSDELAYKLNLSRGTVVHHLNKLIEAGIVVCEKRKYVLRVSGLKALIDEIESDALNACEELRKVAKEIDGLLQ